MAQDHWLQQTNADFSTAAKWSGGVVPGVGDDAILDAAGSTAYTVTPSTAHTVASIQTTGRATLAVTGGTFTATSGTGQGANVGAITIANGAQFEIGGTVDNIGSIGLIGANAANLEIGAQNATLTGGGQVTLGGGLAKRIRGVSPSATLTNLDNTISGAGYIGLNSLTPVNQSKGIIKAFGGSIVLSTVGQSVTNAGLIEAVSGGTLVVAGTTINDTGGGTIEAQSGGRVDLEGADIKGGALTAAGTGVIVVNGPGGALDGSAGAVTLTGVLAVINGNNLALDGLIQGAGKINLDAMSAATELIIAAAGATLSGGGQVNLTSSVHNEIVGATGVATLTNFNDRIAGGGELGAGELILVNDAAGIVTNATSTPLVIDTGANTIQNAGLIATSGAGGTTVDSALNNNGVLQAAHGVLTVNGAVTGSGSALIGDGTLDFTSTFSQNVTFTGTTATLTLAHSRQYGAILYGFSEGKGYAVDLEDIAYGKSTTATIINAERYSVILEVTDGTHDTFLSISTGPNPQTIYNVSSDGHGGTLLVEEQPTGPDLHARTRFIAAMAILGSRSGGALASNEPNASAMRPLLAIPR